MLLEGYLDWTTLDDDDESEGRYPYRRLWMDLRSYFVASSDAAKCWRWLTRQRFWGRWMPTGFEIHGPFVGEYPWAITVGDWFEECGRFMEARKPLPCQLAPTAHDLSSDFSFDAYQERFRGLLVPDLAFFEDGELRWDGAGGYVDSDGSRRFWCPSMTASGPRVLLADRQYMEGFLERHGLVLIWSQLAEKYCVTSLSNVGEYGSVDHSRAHMLADDGLVSSPGKLLRKYPGSSELA